SHGAAAELNRLADDARIFPQRGAPETIRENHDARSFGTVVLRSNKTTEDRVEAHNLEIIAAHDPCLHFARLAQADHRETEGREISERAQRLDASAQVLDFGHGERFVLVPDAQG